jgi:thiol:disulfide interchange protein DsbD
MLKRLFLFLNLLVFLVPAFLSSQALAEDEFLPPEQAFAIQPSKVINGENGPQVLVRWKIADGYYMYRDKVSFTPKDDTVKLGKVSLSPSKTKNDPYFGEIQVYENELIATIDFSSEKKANDLLFITAKSQGCASEGICYPPLKQTISFTQPKTTTTSASTSSSAAANNNQPTNPLAALNNLANEIEAEDDVLDIEQAFKFSLSVNPNSKANELSAIWAIADKHYLYKSKVKFEIVNGNGFSLGNVRLPAGKPKHDDYLGNFEAYYGDLAITLPIVGNGDNTKPLAIKAIYQGCSEAGICYPMVTKNIELDVSSFKAGAASSAMTQLSESAIAAPATTSAPIQSEQDALAGLLSSDNTMLALLTFFLIGLGLAFTPCVFPMIPILSGIIAGQGSKASSNAFVMSVVYVLSMAVVYTVVGVIAGVSGQNLQLIFQNPWVLSTFALIFILLALSMFGFYNLQLPSSLQSKLSEFSNKQEGGTLIGVAIMGVLSALIVGPCMAPPLMGILLFISQTGDPVLGGSALFMMSMGMGIPLIIIGTSAGKLMPKAGVWMDTVKAIFGVAMLGVAIWMMERVLNETVIMWLWALLLFVSGIYMGALTPIHDNTTGWQRLWKALGLVLMLYASLLIIGASSGSHDYLQPLKGQFAYATQGSQAKEQHVAFETIKSIDDLNNKLEQAKADNQYVMLDFYADWCTYCKSMEKTTFTSEKVINALDNYIVLQADVTAMDAVDEALLKAYQIPAPPAILFFTPENGEARNFRIVGYKNGEDFSQHIALFESQN